MISIWGNIFNTANKIWFPISRMSATKTMLFSLSLMYICEIIISPVVIVSYTKSLVMDATFSALRVLYLPQPKPHTVYNTKSRTTAH